MTKDEQIYALFVEANPYPDMESLPVEPEDVPSHVTAYLHVVNGTTSAAPRGADRRARRMRGLTVAAVLVAVVGFGALVIRDLGAPGPAVGTLPTVAPDPVEQVEEFIWLLDSGDVDGAVALLESPLGSIYFPAVDEVTGTTQVADYFEFYLAIGGHTTLSDCVSDPSGPRTLVTCRADQQVDALVPIGLEFPEFPMIFEVWDAGIRRIGWDLKSEADFDNVFWSSRFFEFNDRYLRPNGLVRDSGAPIWSKANGERVVELVEQFLDESP